jgi:hypothetical protein
MRVRILIALALLCSTVHADGPYVSWGMSAWWGRDEIGKLRPDGDATFDLRVGMRVRNVALEAFTAPSPGALSVTGIDAKVLLPLGRYVSPYARLRAARMTVDIDAYYDSSRGMDVAAMHDSGLGVGLALGVQLQFPAYPFGLILPAWFAAPAGPKRTGGIFVEVGDEYYAPEGFWRFAWGFAWGGAF